MKLYKWSASLLLLLLLSGCWNSAMTLEKKNRLLISNEKTVIEVNTPFIQTKSINLAPLHIDRYLIGDNDDACLVYEDVRTENGYRFNYGYKRSIDLIFDAYSVEEQKSYGNLTFYRLTLRDEKRTPLNLLALTSSKQSLKLLYGFDDKMQKALAESLEENATVVDYTLTSPTQKSEQCFKSRWSPKLLIMDNLIGEEGAAVPHMRK